MLQEKFIDRVSEMDTLEKEYAGEKSSLVIIYGRRRVGKTSLINELLTRHPGENLYYLATQESETQNLKGFKAQVADFIGNELLKSADIDWLSVLKMFAEYKTDRKKVLVLDEFQYLGSTNPAFPSILQKAWDSFLKNSGIMLILCGSLITLMKKQTLEYSSPLYGRRTAQIKLKQIRYPYYNEFFPHLSEMESLPFYAVTGGVPKYIETFRASSDIYTAIEENILNPQSYLYEEPYFLLQNEVSEIGSYFSLMKAISMGNRKLADIASSLNVKQTNLTKYLKTLMDLDLIEREVPVTETNPEKSKMGLYKITDNYISFWFQFVYPYRGFLERGEKDYVMGQIKKMFIQNYAAFIYEDLCREKMWEYAANNTWSFRFDRLGKYWGPLCGETDILALDTAGKNMIIGECKYSDSEKGLSVLHNLMEKAEALAKKTDSENVWYVIFSKSGFSRGLIEEAKNNPNLLLISGLG